MEQGAEEAIDEMFAEDGIAHGLADDGGEPLRGATGFKPFFRKFRNAFPDIEVVAEDIVTEGNKVAARCAASISQPVWALLRPNSRWRLRALPSCACVMARSSRHGTTSIS